MSMVEQEEYRQRGWAPQFSWGISSYDSSFGAELYLLGFPCETPVDTVVRITLHVVDSIPTLPRNEDHRY